MVVIVQENRTPDNLFQGLCAPPYQTGASCGSTLASGHYDIQTNNWTNKNSPNGVTQPGLVYLAHAYDLSHAHSAFTAMCDVDPATGNCKMDGAGDIKCSGKCLPQPQFRYVSKSVGQLNPYLDLATQYGWANYMFQTNQGPSYPAHQYIFGVLLSDSVTVNKSNSLSYVSSGPLSFTLLAGHYYDIGAVFSGTAINYTYDFTSDSENGISSIVSAQNEANFANPVQVEHGGVSDISIRLSSPSAATPEPATATLGILGLGFVVLAACLRKRDAPPPLG